MWTDDPVRDAERYIDQQEEWLARRPICSDCGEYIQDDHYYSMNDEPICPTCMENHYRKEIEDYID